MKKKLSLLLAGALALSVLQLPALAEDPSAAAMAANNGRLVISEEGSYTLTGSVRGTVYVDPGVGQVELILDSISVNGGEEPAIQAVSGASLKIVTANDSQNTVTGGGCAISANVPVTFEGAGQLTVSSAGTPIHASKGYALGGGELIFLGGQAIAAPQASNQNSLSLSMDVSVPAGAYLSLKADMGNPVISFTAAQSFTHLLVSKPSLFRAAYRLTADGQPVSVNGNERFVLSAGANRFSASLSSGQNADPWETQYTEATAFAPVEATVPILPASQEQAQIAEDTQTPEIETDLPGLPQEDVQPEFPAPPSFDDGQRPERPQNGENADPLSPPQMNGDQAPEIPQGGEGQLPAFPGHQNFPFAPGGNSGEYDTADTPSEIVKSAAENTAASLEADMENATTYVMTDEDNQVKITESGTYVVTGSSSDGNITVKKATTGVVLVLENLDLTSTTGATVSINKEAEVQVIISGSVTLTDGENPEDENSSDAEVADAFDGAALKIKADSQVYVTGDGTLTINGSAKNGIKAGDNTSPVIDGGVTINITAANDGINGNYDVTLLGGNFTINAGDDAIHADHILTVGREDGTGPSIHVTGSEEGLEGTVVNIFGGDITVKASDDGINAANSDGLYADEMGYAVNMTGGKVTISAGSDGIDSNGDVNLIGGEAAITSANMGGEAGIDYDGQLYISDDFILNNNSGVAGPDGMPGQMNGPFGPGGETGMEQQGSFFGPGGNQGPMPGQMENGQNQQSGPFGPGGNRSPIPGGQPMNPPQENAEEETVQ